MPFNLILKSSEKRFFHIIVKSGHLAIFWKTPKKVLKLYGIPVIENYCISITIKLFPPLRKGGLLLIHTCMFKNHQKRYSSVFERLTPQMKFFIRSLDVQVLSPLKSNTFSSALILFFQEKYESAGLYFKCVVIYKQYFVHTGNNIYSVYSYFIVLFVLHHF